MWVVLNDDYASVTSVEDIGCTPFAIGVHGELTRHVPGYQQSKQWLFFETFNFSYICYFHPATTRPALAAMAQCHWAYWLLREGSTPCVRLNFRRKGVKLGLARDGWIDSQIENAKQPFPCSLMYVSNAKKGATTFRWLAMGKQLASAQVTISH